MARRKSHLLYEPLDLVAKLAALVPRPHKNLVLYHGVLAANAAWRSRVVAYGRQQSHGAANAIATTVDSSEQVHVREPVLPPRKRGQWAELMHRAFGYDLLVCPDCGSQMKLIAVVLERAAIRKMLTHIGLPSEPPARAPARASPAALLPFDDVA